MEIKKFKSGKYLTQAGFNCFVPDKINREWIISTPEILTLLDKSTGKLGALNAFSSLIPDINIFIRMHVVKEATTSSRIEGTQTLMEEAVLYKSQIEPEQRDDWQEVQNYIRAMDFAIKKT